MFDCTFCLFVCSWTVLLLFYIFLVFNQKERENLLEELIYTAAERDKTLKEKDKLLKKRDNQLKERDNRLQELEELIHTLSVSVRPENSPFRRPEAEVVIMGIKMHLIAAYIKEN